MGSSQQIVYDSSVTSTELHLICVSYLHGSGKSQEAVVDPDCGPVLDSWSCKDTVQNAFDLGSQSQTFLRIIQTIIEPLTSLLIIN